MLRRGFTLVELMIVVAIVGVLAVVAGNAYRKYMDSARKSEVYALFGEIRTKEEAYRAEFNAYLGTTTDETVLYPVLLSAGEPKPKPVAPLPAAWTQLGIQPGHANLYCGYAVVADAANTPPAGAIGLATFSVTPKVPWWYVTAQCDNDGDGDASHNATFTTAYDRTAVTEANEHW
jgi:prepilin-type N-terminal cleavage/methylation domain-containing protein